jgi:hypothetical protein
LNRFTELRQGGNGAAGPDAIGRFGKRWVLEETAAFQKQTDSWNQDRGIVQHQLGVIFNQWRNGFRKQQ